MRKLITFCILLSAFCVLFASCAFQCDHAYDNACDAVCNKCGIERNIKSHDYIAADCDNTKSDDGYCITEIKCSEYGKTVVLDDPDDFNDITYESTNRIDYVINDEIVLTCFLPVGAKIDDFIDAPENVLEWIDVETNEVIDVMPNRDVVVSAIFDGVVTHSLDYERTFDPFTIPVIWVRIPQPEKYLYEWYKEGVDGVYSTTNTVVGAVVSHPATSNLKLGSGVARLPQMLQKGVCVSLGTDGAASNNTLDIMREYQLVSILHKGYNRDAEATIASQILDLATLNGAKSQGRYDCGKLKVGNRADIVMIDLNAINNKPCFDTYCTLSYSANSSNVLLTMVDGDILYQNGEFTTIDIEQAIYDFDEICKHYFD